MGKLKTWLRGMKAYWWDGPEPEVQHKVCPGCNRAPEDAYCRPGCGAAAAGWWER